MRRLITIPISHYCEKARWALRRAGLDYREERHVQGVHQLASRRAGGHGTVPVLVCEDGVLGESEDIVRWAAPELLGAPGPERDDVAAVSRWLDAGLGPDGRRWIYAQMVKDRPLLLRFNNQGIPRWEDAFLRALYAAVTPYVLRRLRVNDATIDTDGARVRHAFDDVARRLSDGRPFLCGERFTAADLTFACLAAPALMPPHYGVRLPQPEELPRVLAADVEAFRAHPAGAYALKLFATERR
ncbi:MAG: glutathione S-transferase family protein [Solirubrobacteraceae bacterium]